MMYAVFREATYDPQKLAQGRDKGEEFARLRARQPGFRGSFVTDAGDGRLLIVTFWETQPDAEAARAVLEPAADRLLGSLFASPPRVTARGPVLRSDLR
jgi:heme-degrading monooxygenase HmoA